MPVDTPAEITLADLPHAAAKRAIADALQRRAPVYVFVNPVEYHGPHLPLHNDALISRGLARDLHARLVSTSIPMLVGGDLEMGVDPCPGPGSRAFSFEVVRDACVDVARTLCDLAESSKAGSNAHGLRVVWMTFHGSPLHEHAIEAGVDVVRRRGGRSLNPMNALMDLLVKVDGRRFAPAVAHVDDERERLALLDAIPDDFHGGFFETSMTLHYAPCSVDVEVMRALPPCPALPRDKVLMRLQRTARRAGRTRLADELDLAARSQGWGSLRPFPGYTSSPHRATAQAGAYFADQILGLYAAPMRAALDDGRAVAAPVMDWVRWATLGGRIEAAKKLDLAHVQ
jgi:creatinine amidohydrolase